MAPVRTRHPVPLPVVLAAALGLILVLGCLGGAARAEVAPSLPQGEWPLRPRPEVVRGFEPPASTWGRGHRGVDLRGHPGQPVHAAASGTVAYASRLAGRGVMVVGHGSVRTTYEPVSAALEVGTPVDRGQVIGHLEVGGNHCFPGVCLHWGLLRGRTYLDPLLLVGLGPVRLLPLEDSGPGVRLLVGPAQAVGADVGVDLGGRQ